MNVAYRIEQRARAILHKCGDYPWKIGGEDGKHRKNTRPYARCNKPAQLTHRCLDDEFFTFVKTRGKERDGNGRCGP